MKIASWVALFLLTLSVSAQMPLRGSKLILVGRFDDGEEVSLEAAIKLSSPADVRIIEEKKEVFGGYNDTDKTPFLDKLSLKRSTETFDVPRQALEVLADPEITTMQLTKKGTLYHINFRGSDGEKAYSVTLSFERETGRWRDMEIRRLRQDTIFVPIYK